MKHTSRYCLYLYKHWGKEELRKIKRRRKTGLVYSCLFTWPSCGLLVLDSSGDCHIGGTWVILHDGSFAFYFFGNRKNTCAVSLFRVLPEYPCTRVRMLGFLRANRIIFNWKGVSLPTRPSCLPCELDQKIKRNRQSAVTVKPSFISPFLLVLMLLRFYFSFFAFMFWGLVFILSPELLSRCLRYLDNIINFPCTAKNLLLCFW